MNKQFLAERIPLLIEEILISTGFLSIIQIKFDDRELIPQKMIDIVVQVETKRKKSFFLLIEIKATGQPRYTRMAANSLQEFSRYNQNYYGIFASAFISEESKTICRRNGIGYIDLAGNCFIQFDGVYLNIEGRSNLYPEKRSSGSVFNPKSTRALRVLLSNPERLWFVSDLAKEAKISLGQCSNIKKHLLDNEFIIEQKEENRTKFRLIKPQQLLEKWSEKYSYKKNSCSDYYSFDDVQTIEKKLQNYFSTKEMRYAFSLTSGASLVAPFLRYQRVFSYLADDPDLVAQELGFKKVTTGANITLMQPYDEQVFYDTQRVRDTIVVSDVQLYLDLKSYKERGEEAAEFILENKLNKRWAQK